MRRREILTAGTVATATAVSALLFVDDDNVEGLTRASLVHRSRPSFSSWVGGNPPAGSEGGQDRAFEALLEVLAHVLGVQQLVQNHQRLVLGVLGADHQHVRVRVVLASSSTRASSAGLMPASRT